MPETSRKIDIEVKSEEGNPADKKDVKEKKPPVKKKGHSPRAKGTRKEKDLEKKVKKLKESLADATREKDGYMDKYLRGLAECDNLRKRYIKEKEEYKKYFLGEFLNELLLVSDNLERALQAPSNLVECQSILSGVEMTHKQLMELFKKYHVVEIDALNQPFDPNYHQALSKEEREGLSEEIVIEVYQKGFTYNDKLLRPTLAKVAVPKEEVEDAATEE